MSSRPTIHGLSEEDRVTACMHILEVSKGKMHSLDGEPCSLASSKLMCHIPPSRMKNVFRQFFSKTFIIYIPARKKTHAIYSRQRNTEQSEEIPYLTIFARNAGLTHIVLGLAGPLRGCVV